MSTRSFICDMVSHRYIYCHSDSYPDRQLPILKHFYNTDEKVGALLDLGDISYLDEKITPTPDEPYGATIAYHRDRGEPEEETRAKELIAGRDLLQIADDSWIDFIYIWNGYKWMYAVI